MDAFALVLLAGLVAVLLWMWLLGRYYPGSGAEQLEVRILQSAVSFTAFTAPLIHWFRRRAGFFRGNYYNAT